MRLLVNIFLICLTWTFVQGNTNQKDKMFFIENSSDKDKETLLVATWKGNGKEISSGCEIFTDKDLLGEVSKLNPDIPKQKLPKSDMENLLSDCTELSLRKRRNTEEEAEELSEVDISEEGKALRNQRNRGNRKRANESGKNTRRVSATSDYQIEEKRGGYKGEPIIFPGTKWCGAGDIAENYDDLGSHRATDRCCRAHDLCNDKLSPGESRENITNESQYSALSCECDNDFHACLNRVDSSTSNTVGNLYFNLLGRECYKKDYPQTKKCKKYKSFFKTTCLEYEKDTKAPKVYQWFKPKKYKMPFIPIPMPFAYNLYTIFF